MTDQFGYRDDAGDPYGAWLARNAQTKAEQARTRTSNLANTQTQQQMSQQQESDAALPNILFALGQGQQTGGGDGSQAPSPGQPSMPPGPPGGGAPPMQPGGMSMPMQPGGMSSPSPMGPGASQMPTNGMPQIDMSSLMAPPGAGPNISRINPSSMPPPPPPQQPQGPAPGVQRMSDMGQPPQQPPQAPQGGGGQQNIPGTTPGYDLPSVVQAIKTQYPNISGGALRNMLTTLNPLILTPAARAQLQMIKQMYGSQNLDKRLAVTERGQDMRAGTQERGQDMKYGIGNLDPETSQYLASMYGKFGPQALSGLPQGMRVQVEKTAQAQGVTPDTLMKNLAQNAGNRAESTSAGRQTGQIDVAGQGYSAILPEALKASAAVPREQWKFAAKAGNWLKEQSNDPEFSSFQAFNLGLVREYARSMGGTVSAQNHAMEILGTAKDQKSYEAAAKTLNKEIGLAAKGGKKAIAGEEIPDSPGGIELDGPNPSGPARTATDADGNVYTETADGQWLDPQGKPYGGQ